MDSQPLLHYRNKEGNTIGIHPLGSPPWNAKMGNPITAFATGKTAMMIGYASLGNELKKINPTVVYKTIALPQIKLNLPKHDPGIPASLSNTPRGGQA